MTSALSTDSFTYLDCKMGSKMVLDPCAIHQKDATLQNTMLFLPPHTTSHLQPLDADIIRNVKYYFASLLVCRLLAKLEWKDKELNISTLETIHFIAISWDLGSPTTIDNHSTKRGFGKPPEENLQEPVVATEDWNELRVEFTEDDFVTAANDLVTCSLCTVEDIVEEVSTPQPDVLSSEDEDDDCCSNDNGRPAMAEMFLDWCQQVL